MLEFSLLLPTLSLYHINTILLENILDIFSCNLNRHYPILMTFSTDITQKSAIKTWFIFQSHLINASALHGKTQKHRSHIS